MPSIQTSIAATVSLLVVLAVVSVSTLAYRLTYDAAAKRAIESNQQLLDQLNRTLDTYIETMDALSLTVLNSSEMRDFMQGRSRAGIGDWFASIVRTRADLAAIDWFGADGRVLSSRANDSLNPWVDLSRKHWHSLAVEAAGAPVVIGPHVQDLFASDDYGWVISVVRQVIDPADGTVRGVLKVDMNFSVIEEMCGRIGPGARGYVYVVDQYGDIVYHPRQQLIYSNLIDESVSRVMEVAGLRESFRMTLDGEKRWMSVRVSETTGWRTVAVAYDNELVSNRSGMTATFLFIGVGTLLLGLLLAVLTARDLATPVRRLEKTMNEVERGNLEARIDLDSPAEIAHLGHAFNTMTGTIRDLMAQNIREQEQKRMSELRALQAQINPHFLYNTLDSIIWMAECRRTEEVVQMTSALARLFRIGISRGEEMIPVSAELDHVRSYLTIQKMRYEDKLDFSIGADPSILPALVPKILLQPLVENAIYHGIRNKEGRGRIEVSGALEDGDLVFRVRDDGAGMDEETCSRLMRRLEGGDEGGSVGVVNVQARIVLFFGSGYGLSFESAKGEGTTVTVRLPAKGGERE